MLKRRSLKLLAAALSAAMTMSVFSMMPLTVSADTAEVYSGQTGPGTYSISTTAQLKTLSEMVDGGESYAGSTFRLSGTIDMAAVYSTWNGIGVTDTAATVGTNTSTSSPQITSGAGFAGTIDGASYDSAGNITSIATVKINLTPAKSATGLVGYLASSGTLKNLNITGNISNASTAYDAIGSAVGFNAGTISNVTSNVQIGTSTSPVGFYNVGGIAGFNTGTISNSRNNGAVYSSNVKVGGITGENAGTITGCVNNADIESTYASKCGIGGIAGRNGNNNTAVEVGVITNCSNSGSITCSNGRWVGGIAGFQNSLSSATDCSNTGTITGYGDYDALVGKDEGTSSSGSGATSPTTVTINGNTLSALQTAISNAGAGGTVLINQTVTISEGVTINDNVTIKRAEGFTGELININPGAGVYVTLTSMTVDGEGSGTLLNVNSGRLRLRGYITLTDAHTAVIVQNGAEVETNKTTISDVTYSVDVKAGGSMIYNDFGGTSIGGTVYLENTEGSSDATIILDSALSDSINVSVKHAAQGSVIAKSTVLENVTSSMSKLNVSGTITNKGYYETDSQEYYIYIY